MSSAAPLIHPANTEADFTKIAALADHIWTEHYTPIIGAAQVEYMLGEFQSVPAICEQVAGGMKYFLLIKDDLPVGYFAFHKQKKALFLSKLYVMSSMRGKGFGKAALSFVVAQSKALGLEKITLTVNKQNFNSIKAYEKMGFLKVKAIVQPIGNGYIMDDYVLEKIVN